MKTNYVIGPRQRLARAKTHIRNLDRIVKSFLRRKPYKYGIEPHQDGIHEIHKLKAKRRTLPRSFADISADAIENMRAALDQAVYAIAIAYGITEQRILKKVAFPFSPSATDFPSRLKGVCPNFPQAILTVLESAKPYKGGDDALWAINELANTSKHKTLTPVAFQITSSYAHEIRGLSNFRFPPKWDRGQNEFVLGTAEFGKGVHLKVQFQYSIAFDDIPFLAGKGIVDVLNGMARIVDRLINELESEGCRVGLFK